MNNLPEEFVSLMHEHYDQETAAALCFALAHTEPEVSVRINTRKTEPCQLLPDHSLLEPVSWCPDAYYIKERPAFTFDPLLHAGAYYVQEASSMYIATLLQQHLTATGPIAALDLCAAPGGKSTLLAGLLPQGSTLLSNEPMPKRAQILAENMQKWTRMPYSASRQEYYPVRSIVTNNYPEDFRAFSDCFDLLVTDVPCSGEGMFRKDPQAIDDWSISNVLMCQQSQQHILRNIWHTLRQGGLLIYSTCTFNRLEDEDNARWICSELGGELLTERHFLPGRDRGEGFYCAAIRKTGQDTTAEPADYPTLEGKARKTLRIMPPAFQLEGPAIDLSYDEALQYLRHEVVRTPAPRGIVTLCHRGLPLGPGKCVGNRINNLYPEQWRIRTTYTTPFTLFPHQDE